MKKQRFFGERFFSVDWEPCVRRRLGLAPRFLAGFVSAVLLACSLGSLFLGIGWVQMLQAQQQNPQAILVYPSAAGLVTNQFAQYSTHGSTLGLDDALKFAPAGSLIVVPAGYSETPAASHAVTRSVALQLAYGSKIAAGADNLTVFRVSASLTGVSFSGPLTIDGNGHSKLTAISFGQSGARHNVNGLTIRNWRGKGVVFDAFGIGNYVGYNHFLTVGDGSSLITGDNAIEFTDQDQFEAEHNECQEISGDCVSGGNGVNSSFVTAGGGTYSVHHNYGKHFFRMAIEILSTAARSFNVSDNDFDIFGRGAECLSLSNTPQAGHPIPYAAGNSAIVARNTCRQPQPGGPGTNPAGIGLELFSDNMRAVDNDIQGYWGNALTMQGYGLIEGNHIFGAGQAITVSRTWSVRPLLVTGNFVFQSKILGIQVIGSMAEVSHNFLERMPGFFGDDTSRPNTYTAILASGSFGSNFPSGPAKVIDNSLKINSGIPMGLTVAPRGTAGAASYTYQVAATCGTGTASIAGTTTTGPDTLTPANNNELVWNPVDCVEPDGPNFYKIYRIAGGGTTGLIGTSTTSGLLDTGLRGDGTTPPTGPEIPPGFRWIGIDSVDKPDSGDQFLGNTFQNDNVTDFGQALIAGGAQAFNGTRIQNQTYINMASIGGNYGGSTTIYFDSSNRSLPGRGSTPATDGTVSPVTYANLVKAANGAQLYCSDCKAVNGSVTGGGAGAALVFVNGAWRGVAQAAAAAAVTPARPGPNPAPGLTEGTQAALRRPVAG